MVILAIVILLGTFFYGILEMKKSNKKISEENMRNLKASEKTEVVGIVKGYWKISMMILAIIIGFVFIMISQIIGKTVTHSSSVSVIAVCYSIFSIVVLILRKKNMNKEISKYIK